MVTGMRSDPADMVVRVGRHWGWILAFGIITLLTGVAALVWPGRTLVVVAVLFGIQLIVTGIFWIVSGAIELFTALAQRGMRGRGWTATMGILSILAGIVVLVYPGITLLVLAVVLGVWLLVFGAMQIFLAFQIRSLAGRS